MAGENLVRPKGLKAKWENFWYHYKYFFLSGVALFIALVISVVQCSVKETYDYYFVVVSDSIELAPSQINALKAELMPYGEDIDGDGKVSVSLIDCTFNKNASSYQVIMAKKQKLQSVIMNEEEALVFITEKSCFEWIDEEIGKDFFADLKLSKEDGRYFPLDKTKPIMNAKLTVGDDVKWPTDFCLSLRKTQGTLIEGKENVEKAKTHCNKYINKLISENS